MSITLPVRGAGGAPQRRGIRLPDAGDVPQVRGTPDPGVKVPEGAFGGVDLKPVAKALSDVGDRMRAADEKAKDDARKAAAEAAARKPPVDAAIDRQNALADFNKTAPACLQFDEAVGADLQRLQDDDGLADMPNLRDFQKNTQALVDHLATIVPGDVRPEAGDRFRLDIDQKAQAWMNVCGGLHLDAQERQAETTWGRQVGVFAAQARRDPAQLDRLMSNAETALDPLRTAFDADRVNRLDGNMRVALITGTVGGLLDEGDFDGAHRVVDEKRYARYLSPELKRSLSTGIDRKHAYRQVVAEREQVAAPAAARRRCDDTADTLWSRLSPDAQNPLTLADVDAARRARQIGDADYIALGRVLEGPRNGRGGGRSDPLTALNLTDRMTQGIDVRGDIRDAVNGGRLAAGDAVGLLEKNRTVQRGDDIFASHDYRQGVQSLRDAIVTGQTGERGRAELMKLNAAIAELDGRLRSGGLPPGQREAVDGKTPRLPPSQAVYPIVADIMSRFAEPPSLDALPRSIYGAIADRGQLDRVIDRLAGDYACGDVDEQTFSREDALLKRYEATFDRTDALRRQAERLQPWNGPARRPANSR